MITNTNGQKDQREAIRPILVKLLQGFIFQDDKKYWEKSLLYQEQIKNFFSQLGLYLHINQEEGYAFLKSTPAKLENTEDRSNQEENEESDLLNFNGDDNVMPSKSIIRKMPLSFDVTLLLVLLRESLEQFDVKVSDDYRLILSKSDIHEMLKNFYTEKTDEVLLLKKFDATINKVMDMGLLKELKNNSNNFEVRRVIKAFFDASKLTEIKEKMKASFVQ